MSLKTYIIPLAPESIHFYRYCIGLIRADAGVRADQKFHSHRRTIRRSDLYAERYYIQLAMCGGESDIITECKKLFYALLIAKINL